MGPDQRLLSAMLCDAFISSHNSLRLRLPGTPSQHFEARLCVLARRHREARRLLSTVGREVRRDANRSR
eukprot:4819725-Pyramimonas_sp.AAC.1